MSVSSSQHELDPSLLEAFRYINSVPGKNIRGKLVDCFQLWLKVESDETLDKVKDIVGDLHNASLLIDDIEDNSKLRRGQPVAHSIFGIPQVINTANYVYFMALEKCHSLNNKKAMNVFVNELLNLHRGQGHDISVRCNTPQFVFISFWSISHMRSSGETTSSAQPKKNIAKWSRTKREVSFVWQYASCKPLHLPTKTLTLLPWSTISRSTFKFVTISSTWLTKST
mmetsp:Transcript_2166/g.5085  ORF Transcript_2166/g.5085 Transcript_2166/m.5085 type:complete len:226 (+) Transcript_2166:68-745(+)